MEIACFSHAHQTARSSRDVVAASVAMAFNAPIISAAENISKNVSDHKVNDFELLGVDVIMDDSGSVHLLELQHKPSLLVSSELDADVKAQVFHELQTLLEEQCPVKAGVHCLSEATGQFMNVYQGIQQAQGAETEALSTLRSQIMARNREEDYDALLETTAFQQSENY